MTETGSTVERLRDSVNPEWTALADGCHLNQAETRVVLAVVEAAQEHYDAWARANFNRHEMLPLPIQKIGSALAALNSQPPDAPVTERAPGDLTG